MISLLLSKSSLKIGSDIHLIMIIQTFSSLWKIFLPEAGRGDLFGEASWFTAIDRGDNQVKGCIRGVLRVPMYSPIWVFVDCSAITDNSKCSTSLYYISLLSGFGNDKYRTSNDKTKIISWAINYLKCRVQYNYACA